MLFAQKLHSIEEMEENRIAFHKRFEEKKKMKNNSYELWFYDVWGNEEDGFEVNDRYCVSRDFVIPTMPKTYNRGKPGQFTDFVPSSKELITALVDAGELRPSALTADITIDGDGESIYLTDYNGCPLCELCLNEED